MGSRIPAAELARARVRGIPRWRLLLKHSQIWTHLALIVVSLVVIVPIWWIIATSFKDKATFLASPASLIPHSFSFVNYQYMWTQIPYVPTYLANSFIVSFGTAALEVFITALAGYAFARMHFFGRDIIFAALILSTFVPQTGGLMALYELMAFLHLRNSLIGLILMFASGVPIAIFVMRQTFLAVPRELEEAAMVDGAGWFTVFWRVAAPLGVGGMIVVAILAVVGVWGDYLLVYTMVDQDSVMTISVGVQKVLVNTYQQTLAIPQFQGKFAAEAVDATMLWFTSIPMVLFYLLLQRWFMRGLMQGALKF